MNNQQFLKYIIDLNEKLLKNLMIILNCISVQFSIDIYINTTK